MGRVRTFISEKKKSSYSQKMGNKSFTQPAEGFFFVCRITNSIHIVSHDKVFHIKNDLYKRVCPFINIQ